MRIVRVAAATLWRSPGATGPDDVLTQLLLGERVLVEEARDGWVRGIALDQPAGRLDPRGYPGWLAAADTTEQSIVDQPTNIVLAHATALREQPGGRIALDAVVVGTGLVAAGPAERGWLPVRVPGHDRPLWAPVTDLAGGPEPLDVARRFLGTTYVWGGLNPHGVDCSGLVHLAWRSRGVTLPRDAADQFAATEPVPPGAEQPGDLYFFARPGRPVHHVGIVTGAGRMVHACYTARRVVEEPVRGERLATLVGAHRVPPLI